MVIKQRGDTQHKRLNYYRFESRRQHTFFFSFNLTISSLTELVSIERKSFIFHIISRIPSMNFINSIQQARKPCSNLSLEHYFSISNTHIIIILYYRIETKSVSPFNENQVKRKQTKQKPLNPAGRQAAIQQYLISKANSRHLGSWQNKKWIKLSRGCSPYPTTTWGSSDLDFRCDPVPP